jgi:serine/threonine protein kinase
MNLPLELGTRIRDYRLDAVLGQGGMGCVFAATHEVLGRRVALKLLAPELAGSAEYVSRFESEARIVNGVRHPNIVDIHDFIKEPGRVAYVMELVDGPSLGGLLREGPLSVRQAVNVTFQLASALEAVHREGIVHRDLKPDNVLVLASLSSDMGHVPSVKILDFGIAKTSDGEVSHKTVTGSVLGTPSYMAPEQVAAEPVSPATDVYALGEILYEMVTGQRVFRGDRMAILRGKLSGEAPELSWPDVPGWDLLDQLVRACLAPSPAARPSIGALVLVLNELLALQPDGPGPRTARQADLPMAGLPTPRPELRTPVNMQSVAISPPAPASRWPLVAGAASLVLALAVAASTLLGRADDASVVTATPLPAAPPPAVVAPPPPAPSPVAAAPEPPAAPAPAVVAAPATPEPEASPPEAAPKPARARHARAPRRAPRPAPAAVDPAPAPVKKSEMVSW